MAKRKSNKSSKAASLERDGVLNPSPRRIIDPKFHAVEFFDPLDLVQVKYEMLRRVCIDKASVTQAAAEYGVSRPTIYQAQASFEKAGVAGLVPKKRGPQGPYKLEGDVLAFVKQQVAPGEPIRARELAHLVLERFSIEIHPRTIERAFAEKKTTSQTPTSQAQSTIRKRRK